MDPASYTCSPAMLYETEFVAQCLSGLSHIQSNLSWNVYIAFATGCSELIIKHNFLLCTNPVLVSPIACTYASLWEHMYDECNRVRLHL
jgi:hypothetical protein